MKVNKREFVEFLQGKKLYVENKWAEVVEVLNKLFDTNDIDSLQTLFIYFSDGKVHSISTGEYYEKYASAPEINLNKFLNIEVEDFNIGDILVGSNGQPFIFGGYVDNFYTSIAGLDRFGSLIPLSIEHWSSTARKANATQVSHFNKAMRIAGLCYNSNTNRVESAGQSEVVTEDRYFIVPDFSKKEFRVIRTNTNDPILDIITPLGNVFKSLDEAKAARENLSF